MEIQIGIAKTSRFDCTESRETFEVIERPGGGQSVVFCESKRDGCEDKVSSSLFVNRIIGMIAEGSRDSQAIKTISNQVYHDYAGSVAGKLGIISADLASHSIVVSRCTDIPTFFYQCGKLDEWENQCRLIGSSKNVTPCVTELPIKAGTLVVMLSDGVYQAGRSYQQQIDIPTLIRGVADSGELNACLIADFLLALAVQQDQNQPVDDMSVIVMKINECPSSHVRRVLLTVPIAENQREYF